MASVIKRTAGFGSERTATPRRVLLTEDGAVYLPSGKVIDGTKSRDTANTGDVEYLRAGMLMGKITSSGYYAPSIIGTLSTAHTTNSGTSMTLTAAAATELNRRVGSSGTFKITGPPSSAGTVATETITYSAVDTTTGVVTITVCTTDFIAGSFIQPTDGSETPLCVIPDGYPLKVTDEDNASLSTVSFAKPLIGGVVDASQIVNWPSDTSLRAWIEDQLQAHGLFILDYSY